MMKSNKTKWLSMLLIFTLLISTIRVSSVRAYAEDTINLSYSFGEIQLEEGDNGQNISIAGLSSFNEAGMPDLPSKTVQVLLPQGKKVKSIRVTSEGVRVYENILVEPATSVEAIGGTTFAEDISYNTSVYEGKEQYPATKYSEVRPNTTRGFSLVTMVLYPVVYQNHNLYYTPKMQVRIELSDSMEVQEYSPVEGDEEFLSEDVENKTALNSYFNKLSTMENQTSGSTLLGSGIVDYLIITNNNLAPTFQALADYKTTKGLICAIAKTEDIYSRYSGRDNAEKVRNFLKEAYQINKIKYVLLGGDGDNTADSSMAIIPSRLFYSDPIEGTDMPPIASDAYYGCLQGDYDYNVNGVFGEISDGENGNDVDLTYDVYVGRAPVDDVTEADNFIQKTINYEKSTKTQTALMIGEQLQGNYSCSIDMAASAQSTLSQDSLTDNIRKLRDSSIKEEYVELYYDNNSFMKSIFTSNIGLLTDFSGILLNFYKPIKNYLNDKDTYILNEEDVKQLNEFCDILEKEVRTSTKECSDKDKIAGVIHDIGVYIEQSEDKSLTDLIQNSTYYSTDVKPLGQDIYGGNYKDQIRYGSSENDITTEGISASYQVSTLYDRDSSGHDWDKSQVIDALNASPQLVNHLGHADTDSLMKLSVKEIKGLSNASAFFYYSQGCFPGSFDNMQSNESYSNEDSIAEELVVSNKISGAFAAVVNSRYGWYDGEGTKGPSQIFDRWFWDGLITQEHTNMGRLVSYSKEKILDRITNEEHGTVLRFCFYTINLLGDPETELNKSVTTTTDTTIPQQLTAVVNNNGAALTWNPAADTVNYQLFQYDFGVNDYVKLGETINTSYTIDNLTWGNNIFVVRAVRSNGTMSGYSNQTMLNNTSVLGFSLKSKNKQANLSWKVVGEADGYYVYRATSKSGKYSKIGTITKSTITSYTDKKVKKSKKYYYKLCAYKKVNNDKILGNYTAIEGIRIK